MFKVTNISKEPAAFIFRVEESSVYLKDGFNRFL
jgi:hypothetical protein